MRIGLSTIGEKEKEADFLDNCKASGITDIEISPTYEMIESFDYKTFIERANKTGINVWSLHLPFWPFEIIDIASTDEELRKSTVEYYEKVIKTFSKYGIKMFIVHPSGEPIEDSERKTKLEASKKSLGELAKIASLYGATVAVEDLPRSCLGNTSEEILYLLSADERLVCCFDTNHILYESPYDFAGKIGSKIKTLHISDYDFKDECHLMPFEGKIDWKELVSLIKDTGYSGPWLYEVPFGSHSFYQREMRLTTEDFKENAIKLLS